MEEHKKKLKEFLSRYLRVTDFKDEDDIFALGFVNSLFAMQLVTFIENQFLITVEDEDLDLTNFNSVNAMACFIDRKNHSQQQASNAL